MTPDEGNFIVKVNKATQDELETIPSIAPVLPVPAQIRHEPDLP
jgi:hypothetical protein